ncbi:hypothetical protein C8R46DRAFT_1024571 [Mycena filopes]|nr:hypothetical protein C8R46DRAFT_1024571 [Mycena filopes]
MEREKPLLPGLRSLICRPLIPEAILFLNSSLRRITFDSIDEGATLTFLSAALAKTRGRLHDLRVTFKGPFNPAIHACIAKFRAISQLDLDLPNSPLSKYVELDRSLAKISGLQLYAVAAPHPWDDEIHHHNLARGFPDLEAFLFEGGFSFLKAALGRVQSTNVSRVQISLRRRAGPALDWRPLFRSIRPRSSTLRKLQLDLGASSIAIPLTALFDSIGPMYDLEEFCLRNYWPIVISDRDIQQLAENGRSLEMVVLVAGKDGESVAPSIACLTHLARHCPSLLAIEMSLKSDFSRPLKVSGNHKVRSNKLLRAVYIRGMLLSPDPGKEKIRAITQFIDTIFPWVYFVKNISVVDPCWKEVESSVKRLQAVRAERELGP